LIEEFRPIVVAWLLLSLINRRRGSRGDLEEPLCDAAELAEKAALGGAEETDGESRAERPHAVWLGETGRRVFFREWGRRLRESIFYEPRREVRTLEDIMKLQVYHYGRVVRGEEPAYAPFVPR